MDPTIAQLQQRLDDKDTTIADCLSLLDEKDATIADFNALIVERDAAMTAKDMEIKSLKRRNGSLKTSVKLLGKGRDKKIALLGKADRVAILTACVTGEMEIAVVRNGNKGLSNLDKVNIIVQVMRSWAWFWPLVCFRLSAWWIASLAFHCWGARWLRSYTPMRSASSRLAINQSNPV